MKLIIKRVKGAHKPIRAGFWVCDAQGDYLLWAGMGRSRRQARVLAKARARSDVPRRLFLKK